MNPIEIQDPATLRAAVLATLDAALERGTRSLLFCSPAFEGWPLDEPALLDALAAWLRRPGRHLLLLADGYGHMERRFPRFTQWRSTWSHAIDARTPDETSAGGLDTLLLDDGPTVLQLWQTDPPRGRAHQDAAAAAAARDRIDASAQRSTPAWPIRPLGL